jgi:hypothetical protein
VQMIHDWYENLHDIQMQHLHILNIYCWNFYLDMCWRV